MEKFSMVGFSVNPIYFPRRFIPDILSNFFNIVLYNLQIEKPVYVAIRQ